MKELSASGGEIQKSCDSNPANSRLEETLRRLGWENYILYESEDEIISVHDTEYNIHRVSKAIEKLFGKDVVGQKCYRAYHERDTICAGCPTEKLLTTGELICSGEQTANDRTYSIQSFPLADEHGNIVAVVEHAVDITGNKEAEKKLRETITFWNTVFNSVNDAVAVINVADFTIVEVNHAFLETYGLTREQVIGKTCHAVTHQEAAPCNGPEHSCPLIAAVTSGQIAAIEHIHYSKNGKRIALEVSAAPIRNEKGKIEQVVHVARDITERKMAQQQLMINDRLASVGMLASGIAHEVGNPLTVIMGYANTLPLMAELPAEVKDGLKVIQEESQRAADILKNLLTFARSESAEKHPVNVIPSIQRVLKLRAYNLKKANITVNTQMGPDIPKVVGDRSQLEQVFYNIVANAESAMFEAHQQGNLTVTVEGKDRIVRITFADDGPGIPQENLGRIFTPFFTTKEVGQGTGLGLSMCLGIIANHNGRLWAESTEGKGATFIIELPALK